jgi:hypothetical protein
MTMDAVRRRGDYGIVVVDVRSVPAALWGCRLFEPLADQDGPANPEAGREHDAGDLGHRDLDAGRRPRHTAGVAAHASAADPASVRGAYCLCSLDEGTASAPHGRMSDEARRRHSCSDHQVHHALTVGGISQRVFGYPA